MSFKKTLVSSSAILVGGTLFLSASSFQSPAVAAPEDSFRFFRDQNPDLNRHAARQMFRAEQKAERIGFGNETIQAVPPVINVITRGSDGIILCGTSEKPNRQERVRERHQDHVRNQTLQTLSQSIVRLNNGIDLDLTSQVRNITLGRSLFSDESPAVTITVGGVSKTLTAGSHVTAAEYVAVKQLLSNGSQQVTVGSSGSATGGSVDLSSLTSDNDVMRASNLVVAANVTTSGDFGKRSDFRLLGNLENYGTLQAFSSDSNVRGGAIRANDINNHSNALISSSVDLTLDASGNFNNDGTIVSTQGLTVTAGGALSNKGAITSAGDLNLNAALVKNSGTIQSSDANLNLNGSAGADLTVQNSGGALNALNGAINLRDATYAANYASTIYGGDLHSRSLNVNAGAGTANVHVSELTGTVNETGANAHVSADTELLSIGSVCLTGDPTYYNTAGSIAITGNISVPDAVTIVAAGDISSAPGVIVQAGTATAGKPITLIAGADFSVSGGEDTNTVPAAGKEGSVFLSGKSSKTGGSIILATGTAFNTRPTNLGVFAAGGDVQMYAFAKGNTGGVIDLSNTSIQTGGAMNGVNGSVELVAGTKSGDAIKLGTIQAGSGGTGGKLNVVTAQPVVSGKGPVQYDPTGALVGTTRLTPGKSLTDGGVIFNGSSGFNDTITVRSGGDIDVAGGLRSNVSISLNASGNIVQNGAGLFSSPAITMIAKGSMGVDLQPIVLGGDNISVFAGGSAFLESSIGGPVIVSGNVADTFRYFNSSADVQVQNFSGTTLDVTANSVTIDTLTQESGLKNLVLDIRGAGDLAFALSGIDSLNIKAAGNLGTQANAVLLSDIKNVVLNSAKGAFVALGGKTGSAIDITTVDNAAVGGSNKKTVLTNATSSNGAVIYAGSSNLTVDGNINAKTGIVVQSEGESNSKIVIKENSSLNVSASTDGIALFINATPPPDVNVTPQKNVLTSGTVVFRGAGVKASSPNNILTAQGSGVIQIFNGYKQGNISLGGGVTMLSVGP